MHRPSYYPAPIVLAVLFVEFYAQLVTCSAQTEALLPCGDAFYYASQYTCYPTDFLCPILNNQPTLKCGPACFLPTMYSCVNDELIYPPASSSPATPGTGAGNGEGITCAGEPTTLQLNDPPYDNYFYSDCHSASQVVVTSPIASSDLTLIGPRLLIAWPAGNSGIVAFFAPQSGANGTLSLSLSKSSTSSDPLEPIYISPSTSNGNPVVGISGLLKLNAAAALTVPILGSVRTIRDFTEGPSLLRPQIQDAITHSTTAGGSAVLKRLWLDNVTTTSLSFSPAGGGAVAITVEDGTLTFGAGVYRFNATFNYPQLTPLNASSVLNPASEDLIEQQPTQTKALAFLSTTEKLLAGAWRFLTYFGRDSMISLLLLQPVLSQGRGGAIEAVIGAVLERINATDGSVCHEETIGDYATWLHLQDNVTSTASSCSYVMIDSDFYLPVVTAKYFLDTSIGRSRTSDFFAQEATLPFGNEGTSYADLFLTNAEKLMTEAAPFAAAGGQVQANLAHLKADQIVGQWRDSTYGIGGGRMPFDCNTALMPAALRAISALAAAGFFPSHADWASAAAKYAQVWEDSTLSFFAVSDISVSSARSLVTSYVAAANFTGPTETSTITHPLTFYALSLDGNDGQSKVRVMNTDTAFRLYLLNTTNDAQLSTFLNATASSILLPYPAGLMTPVGLLVANPAYGDNPVYAANFTRADYHGTVVWGWPMAMMAAGLERQLARCSATSSRPAFCGQSSVYNNVRAAYNALWDVIEANEALLSNEVWSWTYADGGFQVTQLAELSPTESDIVQLWSLTYLAVKRDDSLR